MTVRVVGEAPEVTKRATCKNCGAILEYTPSDTTTETHRDYGGGSDTYRILHCPRCSERIILGVR